jgi:hypothetical protein
MRAHSGTPAAWHVHDGEDDHQSDRKTVNRAKTQEKRES